MDVSVAFLGRHDREPLLKILEEAGVPATPVNTVEQVTNDPRTATRRMIERVVHPKLGEIPVVGMPTKFSGMQTGGRRPAPLHGEHTDEVLAGCGDAPEEIVALRTKEVVR